MENIKSLSTITNYIKLNSPIGSSHITAASYCPAPSEVYAKKYWYAVRFLHQTQIWYAGML